MKAILKALLSIAFLAVLYSLPTSENIYMAIDPLTIAALASAASGAIGAARNAQRPDVPDFQSEAAISGRAARNRLIRAQEKSLDNLIDTQLSGGLQGASLTESVIGASTDALADIDARIAQSVAQAGNRERAAQFAADTERFQGTNKSISNILQAGTLLALASQNPLEAAINNQVADAAPVTTVPTVSLIDEDGPNDGKAVNFMTLLGDL